MTKNIYNVDAIIAEVRRCNIDISPRDRKDWIMFGSALFVLGYDEDIFCLLSSGDPKDSHKVWRQNKNLFAKYVSEDQARAKIVALAKNAGMDLNNFLLSQDDEDNSKTPGRGSRPSAKETPRRDTEATQSKNTPLPGNYIIPNEIVDERATKVRDTSFYVWLKKEFGEEVALKALEKYRVGAAVKFTTPEGYNAVGFPLINTRGECIDIKIMIYNPETGSSKSYILYSYFSRGEGHEVRQSFAIAEMNKEICFGCRKSTPRPRCPGKDFCPMRRHRHEWSYFGEHLLKGLPKGSPVAVVESEKTAIIGSIVFPEYIWIATGSISNLNADRAKPLKEYNIIIFPDRDGVEAWKEVARGLAKQGYKVQWSRVMENYQGDPKDDLADIILRYRHGGYNTAPHPPTIDHEGPMRDSEGNFIPWRRAVPEPSDPMEHIDWIVAKANWRNELREQCHRCEYSQILGGQFRGCRQRIQDEEAASLKQCRGYKEKSETIII